MDAHNPKQNRGLSDFDRLMRGLVAVPKAELDREIAREQRAKEKARAKGKPGKKK